MHTTLRIALALATVATTALPLSLYAQEAFSISHMFRLTTLPQIEQPEPSHGVGVLCVNPDAEQIQLRLTLATPGDTVTQVIVRQHTTSGSDPDLLTIPYPAGVTTVSTTLDIFEPRLYEALDSNQLYLDLRSLHHPDGYMLGDIMMVQTANALDFNGAQVSPPVSGSGFGIAWVSLDRSATRVRYYVAWQGLTGEVQAVSIHRGTPGTNGPLVKSVPISPGAEEAQGVWEGLSSEDIDALRQGNLYVAVNTAPGGATEIRGQLVPNHTFAAALDPRNQVPPISTSLGNGTAVVSVWKLHDGSAQMGCIGVFGDMDGSATTVGIHVAPMAATGPLLTPMPFAGPHLIDFDSTYAPGALGNDDIADLLAERAYFNISSTEHSDGELRGQLIAAGGCARSSSVEPVSDAESSFSVVFDHAAESIRCRWRPAVVPERAHIRVSDMAGHIVRDEALRYGVTLVNVGGIPAGMYMVQLVVGDDIVTTARVVVMR